MYSVCVSVFCACVSERQTLQTNHLDFCQTQLRYFIKEITACFGLQDHHQAIITKKL